MGRGDVDCRTHPATCYGFIGLRPVCPRGFGIMKSVSAAFSHPVIFLGTFSSLKLWLCRR